MRPIVTVLWQAHHIMLLVFFNKDNKHNSKLRTWPWPVTLTSIYPKWTKNFISNDCSIRIYHTTWTQIHCIPNIKFSFSLETHDQAQKELESEFLDENLLTHSFANTSILNFHWIYYVSVLLALFLLFIFSLSHACRKTFSDLYCSPLCTKYK